LTVFIILSVFGHLLTPFYPISIPPYSFTIWFALSLYDSSSLNLLKVDDSGVLVDMNIKYIEYEVLNIYVQMWADYLLGGTIIS
jgi:hypothetical protein